MTVSDDETDLMFDGGVPFAACSPETSDSWAIEPTTISLLDQPLDFIFAEHYRQRKAVMILKQIADGGFDQDGVCNLITFLEKDFAFHIGDEELGLFPLLREHCKPEDRIDELLGRLADEHKGDETVNDEVLGILRRRMSGQNLSQDDNERISSFADHIRKHLAIENAVMLPLARARLDVSALATLSGILKHRR